jgi:tetratricopeptide (TPR) repeat protein
MGAMRSRGSAVLALGAILLASGPARADNHGEAVKHFEEGRKLRDRGELEKAARVFQLSISLEPSIGAFYNLGLINEQLGHARDAADAFRKSVALAREKNDAREKDAVEQLGKLLDAHNHVILDVPEDIAAAPGLRIVVDGEPVPRAQFNGEVFRGPSSHVIVVSATGRKDLELQARNRQQISVVLGHAAAPGGGTAVPPPPPPARSDQNAGGWGWQKWTGVGLMGAGAVTGVVAVVFAAKHASASSDFESAYAECKMRAPQNSSCLRRDADALGVVEKHDEKDSSGTTAWILGGIGAGMLVGGAILFLTASAETASPPAATQARVRVSPTIGTGGSAVTGLSVVGTF